REGEELRPLKPGKFKGHPSIRDSKGCFSSGRNDILFMLRALLGKYTVALIGKPECVIHKMLITVASYVEPRLSNVIHFGRPFDFRNGFKLLLYVVQWSKGQGSRQMLFTFLLKWCLFIYLHWHAFERLAEHFSYLRSLEAVEHRRDLKSVGL
ncbi:Uncharacterized protein PODLI_1B021534, partial [Podarcis lilfordi]